MTGGTGNDLGQAMTQEIDNEFTTLIIKILFTIQFLVVLYEVEQKL